MMSNLSRIAARIVFRNLQQKLPLPQVARISASAGTSKIATFCRSSTRAAFSSMPTLKDQAQAVPAPAKQFDHEITDMASYVHNYKVDSELAVSSRRFERCTVGG